MYEDVKNETQAKKRGFELQTANPVALVGTQVHLPTSFQSYVPFNNRKISAHLLHVSLL